MDPIAPPPVPDPTTPNRLFPRTNRIATPNRFTTTFATSSQPVGSTQRALQESLTDNVVFANETIVHAIFQPSKVDDQIIMDILVEIDHDNALKAAREAVLSGKLAERKKYKSMVSRQMLISEYADLGPLDCTV